MVVLKPQTMASHDSIKVPRDQLRNYRLLRQLSPKACASVRSFLTNHSQVFAIDNRRRLILCDRSLKRAKQIVLNPAEEIKSIACGNRHTVALTHKGAVLSWGLELSNAPKPGEEEEEANLVGVETSNEGNDDDEDDVNSGTSFARGDPLKVVCIFKSGIVSIKCGDAHTLALDEEGNVHAWGSNRSGQLGTGTKQAQDHLRPDKVDITKPDRCVEIAAGRYHSLALTESGQVIGWGSSRFGQLGRERVRAITPELIVSVLHLRIKAIAAGGFNSAFLATNGALYVCGYLGCSLGDHVRRVLIDTNIERIFICPFANTERMFLVTLKDESKPGDGGGAEHSHLQAQSGRCYVWGDIRDGATLVEPKLFHLTPNEAVLEFARQQRFPEMMDTSMFGFRLGVRIGRAFDCPKTSDVVFVFTREGGQTMHAHRTVLVATNAYFRSMLSGRWYPKRKSVEIDNWPYRLFRAYLAWIYLGELEARLSFDEACALLDMSTCMLDVDFSKVCWDYLLDHHLSVRTVCVLFRLCSMYPPSLEQLNQVKFYLFSNFSSVRRSSTYKKLPAEVKTEVKKLKHGDNQAQALPLPPLRPSILRILWPFGRQLLVQQPLATTTSSNQFF